MLCNSTSNFGQTPGLIHTLNSQPMSFALDCMGLDPDSPALVQRLPQAVVQNLQGIEVGAGGGLGDGLVALQG